MCEEAYRCLGDPLVYIYSLRQVKIIYMCMSTRRYENSFETHTYICFSLNLDQDGKVDRYICVDIDISF